MRPWQQPFVKRPLKRISLTPKQLVQRFGETSALVVLGRIDSGHRDFDIIQNGHSLPFTLKLEVEIE